MMDAPFAQYEFSPPEQELRMERQESIKEKQNIIIVEEISKLIRTNILNITLMEDKNITEILVEGAVLGVLNASIHRGIIEEYSELDMEVGTDGLISIGYTVVPLGSTKRIRATVGARLR